MKPIAAVAAGLAAFLTGFFSACAGGESAEPPMSSEKGTRVTIVLSGPLTLKTEEITTSVDSGAPLVLGSRNFIPNPNYRGKGGWGTVRPRAISNAGVPSGNAFKIHWRSWGSRVAKGRGRTWLYRPTGGYFAKPGAIELRAYGLGKCSPTGPRAYLHLKARVANRPGGPLGQWFIWGGQRNLCRWS